MTHALFRLWQIFKCEFPFNVTQNVTSYLKQHTITETTDVCVKWLCKYRMFQRTAGDVAAVCLGLGEKSAPGDAA